MLTRSGREVQRHPLEVERDLRALRVQGAFEWEFCRRNPLYYLERYCWSVDEHNRKEPVQPLIHGDYAISGETLRLCREIDTDNEDDFLRYTALIWAQEPLVGVPKSRQLRITHLMVACHGWLAQFYDHQRILFQSKDFEDADALLERLHQSWMVQRQRHPNLPWRTYRRIEGKILLEGGSIIQAAAQGAAVVRSYTFSAIFSDEMGFQDKAEDAYTAAIPTIEGGGKYTAVSTPETSFFEDLVFDRTGRR